VCELGNSHRNSGFTNFHNMVDLSIVFLIFCKRLPEGIYPWTDFIHRDDSLFPTSPLAPKSALFSSDFRRNGKTGGDFKYIRFAQPWMS
jgi:hypothetical protein